MRIEHVLSAADKVMAGQQCARKINGVERLKDQQSASYPGKYQRTLQPQTDSDEEVPHIAEEKKILCSILVPVDRRPHDQPYRPADLEPEGDAHGALLYAMASYHSAFTLLPEAVMNSTDRCRHSRVFGSGASTAAGSAGKLHDDQGPIGAGRKRTGCQLP